MTGSVDFGIGKVLFECGGEGGAECLVGGVACFELFDFAQDLKYWIFDVEMC